MKSLIEEEIQVGDLINVNVTGTRPRVVVSIHDNYVMVERQRFYQNKNGPAQVWFKSITRNISADERYEAECDRERLANAFWNNIDAFETIVDDLVVI